MNRIIIHTIKSISNLHSHKSHFAFAQCVRQAERSRSLGLFGENYWNTILYILPLVFLLSCQDDNFEVPYYQQKVVVDGWIEQNQPARVFLTLSAPYFSELDSLSIRQLVLTHAKVTVIDGASEEILTLKPNYDYFPPYLYESTYMRGKIGHTYQLKVESGGKIITATTQIPLPQALDSLWFQIEPNVDTAGYIWIRFNDTPGVDNYYRIMTRTGTQSEKYIPGFLPNFDGRLIDGQSMTMAVFKGNDNPLVHEDYLFFNQNDTVFIKFCTMDQSVYSFWSSVQEEISKAGNPFASTNTRILSNVNGGIGVWAGYGASYYRIICSGQ